MLYHGWFYPQPEVLRWSVQCAFSTVAFVQRDLEADVSEIKTRTLRLEIVCLHFQVLLYKVGVYIQMLIIEAS